MRSRARGRTGGFHAFIPPAFHPDNNQMRNLPRRARGTLRYMLPAADVHNIPHIRRSDATGVDVARRLVRVDDLDGPCSKRNLPLAGSPTPYGMTTPPLTRPVRRRPRPSSATLSTKRQRSGRGLLMPCSFPRALCTRLLIGLLVAPSSCLPGNVSDLSFGLSIDP